MIGVRQAFLGVFMAFLFGALVLGSLSLSLIEGGYALIPAPTSFNTPIAFGQATYKSGISTPTATLCAAHPADWVAYTVRPDDTLRGLAELYRVDAETFARNNCLMAGMTALVSDTTLFVPPGLAQATSTQPPASATPCQPPSTWVTYIVRLGDTWKSLGIQVGYSAKDLRQYNCMPASELVPGQPIRLPFYIAIYPTPTYGLPPTPFRWPTPTSPWIFPPTWTPQVPVPPSVTPLPPTEIPPPTLPVPPTPTEAPPPTLPVPPTPTEAPPPTEVPPPPTDVPPPTEVPPPPPTEVPPPPPTDVPPPTSVPPTSEPPVVNPPPVVTVAPAATPAPVETLPPGQPVTLYPFRLTSATPW